MPQLAAPVRAPDWEDAVLSTALISVPLSATPHLQTLAARGILAGTPQILES